MDKEDGQLFVKNLAYFVRTHERALANALQLQRQGPKNGQQSQTSGSAASTSSNASSSTSSTLASALSLPYLGLSSAHIKPAKLTLTPHHLFYLLSRYEELGVTVGPMNVRLENIHTDAAPTNYVSFLGSAPKSRGRASDADSMHSVSSVRSVMSSMSSMWSHFSLSNSAAKIEKQQAQIREDLRYLYSAFTKIPCLRLAPDHHSRLIAGYEEFPFDTAVPLFVFKNISVLEVCDLDFRQFYGWDRLAEQLRSLTIKRGNVDDPIDLLLNIVLDDMDKRRRRSSKAPAPATPASPAGAWPSSSPSIKPMELARSMSTPNSPLVDQRRGSTGSPLEHLVRGGSSEGKKLPRVRQRSISPSRPPSSRQGSSYGIPRSSTPKLRRSSGSSGSSTQERTPRHSASNLIAMGMLPSSKWRFLRHLSLADNSLTSLTTSSLAPIAGTLQSFDLSGNLFSEIPDALASLTHLRALNLANCMIESLHSLSRNPLPAITTLNLRSNRLVSLAGIERLYSLERLDIRANRLMDPTELARLTGIPDIIDLYVAKNPFVKTHSNYRVTIFNLFRTTPGHTHDVTIDTSVPTYNERRQLSDRVPEAKNVPIVRPPPEDESPPPPTIEAPTTGESTPLPPSPYAPRRTSSEYGVRSQRKRRVTKRRIVELAAESIPSPTESPPLNTLEPTPSTPTDSTYGSGNEQTPYHTAPTTINTTQSQPSLPPLNTALASPTPVRNDSTIEQSDSLAREPEDISLESDTFRQKIEAFKHDYGSNWLNAFNEGKWEDQKRDREREFSPTRTIRPHQAPHRSVSVGGRTLG